MVTSYNFFFTGKPPRKRSKKSNTSTEEMIEIPRTAPAVPNIEEAWVPASQHFHQNVTIPHVNPGQFQPRCPAYTTSNPRGFPHYSGTNLVHPSLLYNISQFPAPVGIPEQRISPPTICHPKFPSPQPNQFMVYLLQYCPQRTSVCFGCGNTLKPGGNIGNPPMDLAIVSHMVRSWVQDNQVFSKPANVYFHCLPGCVQKKQPYFQPHVHCHIPDEIVPLLTEVHQSFIRQNLGIM